MKNVLVLVFTNLRHDARVMRQVDWLRKRFNVSVVCFDAEPSDFEVIKVKQTSLTLFRKVMLGASLLLRAHRLSYKLFHDYGKITTELSSRSWDLVIANDVDTLPMAFEIAGKAKIIFDAHEYAPRHFEDKLVWRLFFQPLNVHLCKQYIPRVDGMITVGKGIADEYAKNFGVRPVIITNAPRYHDIQAVTPRPGTVRLIHQGIANSSRRLDIMIDMMELLDERFTLDLILMTSDYASAKTKAYIDSLEIRAKKNGRIRILPAVKNSQVLSTINAYDIGVFILPPVNFNYANTLPNKLFEFIQARLGVAIGPSPEMAGIVNKYSLGVVAEDFTAASLARKLNALTERDIMTFKANAAKAAVEENAEKNEILFNALIDSLPH